MTHSFELPPSEYVEFGILVVYSFFSVLVVVLAQQLLHQVPDCTPSLVAFASDARGVTIPCRHWRCSGGAVVVFVVATRQ